MKNENSDSNHDINRKIIMLTDANLEIGKETTKTLTEMGFINRTILVNLLI